MMKITFVDDETFDGSAEGDVFSQCEIMGKKEGGAGLGKNGSFESDANTWEYEYEQLDEDNYERERVGRWH
jgi:hypothetical protein